MKKLLPFIRPFYGGILMGMILKGVGSIADIALPLLLSRMVDEGIAQNDMNLILQISLVMLAVTLASAASTLAAHYLTSNCSQKVGQNIREKLYAHVQGLSLQDAAPFSAATLTSRVTFDIEKIMSFISSSMRMVVRNVLLGIGGLAITIALDWQLTLTLLAAMLIILCISAALYRMTHRLYRRVQEGLDRSANIVRESLTGIKTIKAFDKVSRECARFAEQSAQVRDNEVAAGTVSAVLSPSITFISNLGLCALLVVSAYRINSGHVELGGLIAIVSYLNMVVHSMTSIPRIFINYSRASASAARITELLETQAHPPAQTEDCRKEEAQAPAIQFEDVTFCYRSDRRPALRGVSFSVPRGTTLAIIGSTGSGKTTLVQLMAGLFHPQQGRILVDGMDIRNYASGTLHKKISVAQQQYDIFTNTVRENIVLAEPYEKKRFGRAVRQAQLESFVSSLPDGEQTDVYQAGANLSGGQRQRLNVARLFYSGAPILVFDDVASALDFTTNRRLQEELHKLQHQKTVIMIAQRISAIQGADRILVLDRGRVAGSGTHEELLESCETYRAICASQGEVVHVGKNG